MEDVVSVKGDCARDEVLALINRILGEYKRRGRGASTKDLPEKLLRDLTRSDWQWLSKDTYAQLSFWCWPDRFAQREQFVQPFARKISQLLFGDVISRVQGS